MHLHPIAPGVDLGAAVRHAAAERADLVGRIESELVALRRQAGAAHLAEDAGIEIPRRAEDAAGFLRLVDALGEPHRTALRDACWPLRCLLVELDGPALDGGQGHSAGDVRTAAGLAGITLAAAGVAVIAGLLS